MEDSLWPSVPRWRRAGLLGKCLQAYYNLTAGVGDVHMATYVCTYLNTYMLTCIRFVVACGLQVRTYLLSLEAIQGLLKTSNQALGDRLSLSRYRKRL